MLLLPGLAYALLGAVVWFHLRSPASAMLAAGGLAVCGRAWLPEPRRLRWLWMDLTWLGAVVLVAGTRLLLFDGVAAALVATAVVAQTRGTRDALVELTADRDRIVGELARRLSELYSLQELTHILSSSLHFDLVIEEVTRYAMRFLDAAGAAVVLAPEDDRALRVVAARGSLEPHVGELINPESGGIVLDAIGHERLELTGGEPGGRAQLFGDVWVESAAVAPLRAHGVTTGALVVAGKLTGRFAAEDARLLSTVAIHTAVVLANARFFELVRRGKEQWEATFDALSEGIALVDGHGHIRRANAGFAALIGDPIPAVIGRHLCHALFGEEMTLAPMLGAARRGERTPALVRRSEPLDRILRIAVAPVPVSVAGTAVVVVVEDITEQKALEAQLIQSEKMAAVGILVSGIAHELNNPLTSIAGLSEFLLEQTGAAESDREHLRVINEQTERASRIVKNLLTFARQGPSERTTVDLGDVVQRTLILVGYELKLRGVTVETSVAPGLPPVLGDRYQLQQVVLNLLTNATHALTELPPGAARRIGVMVATTSDRVVVRVSDSGPGMTEEVRSQIFSPFFTTKAPGEGTGLGLFVSYGIAEAHGGTLTAESRPGHGATFVLSVPSLTHVQAPARAAAPSALAGLPSPGRRILVVDDDPVVRRLVTALFAREGHRVDAAADGAEAVRLVTAEHYDLLLVDRRAAVDGEPFVTVLEHIHADWAPRVIVLTSDVRATPADGEVAVGRRLLRKPLDLRDLRAAAAAVWEGAGAP